MTERKKEKKGAFCFALCFYENKNWLIIPAWIKVPSGSFL